MSSVLGNSLRAIVTASVIMAGLGASTEATELRWNSQSGQSAGVGGLTTGVSKGGGSGSLPDLVPIQNFSGNNGLPETGYCGPWNGGDPSLFIRVRNFGGVPAAASQVTVQFASGHVGNANVPALNAGSSATVQVPIPDAAWPAQFHASVHFNIIANATGAVVESNMANNTRASRCIGPAT